MNQNIYICQFWVCTFAGLNSWKPGAERLKDWVISATPRVLGTEIRIQDASKWGMIKNIIPSVKTSEYNELEERPEI